MTLLSDLENVMNDDVTNVRPLSGGCVGNVVRFESDATTWVAKVGDPESALDVEGQMLSYLAEHSSLPVPTVKHSSPELLVMTYVEHDGRDVGGTADGHAAQLLGALHGISSTSCGLSFDTLIGGLHQPNPTTDSWIDFFGTHRLRHMTQTALDRGRLTDDFVDRMEAMIAQLPSLIDEPDQMSLLHGDVWGGNVLIDDGRIAALIDPAIYFGHYEVELAFIGMFHTFGESFYDAYPKSIDAEFFSTRRDVYNLFPLLVHVSLFGGAYVRSVDRTLRRFGC